MEIALFIFIGLMFGVLIGLLIGKGNTSALRTKTEMMDNVISQLREEVLQREAKAKEDTKQQYENILTSVKENHELQNKEQERRFEETMAKVAEQMKTATDEMLKKRQSEFSESSNKNMEQIVNPLLENIEKMKRAMETNTMTQTDMGGQMKVYVENLIHQSETAQKSTDELTKVLKAGGRPQGDWGETILDELLTSQGLTRGVHYEVQSTLKDASGNTVVSEEGNRMRPDVILHLDETRDVIIDSKVSLTAFFDYVNAENEADRKRLLDAHCESINKHVKELAKKDYSSYIKAPKVKMDYVIMFVPNTGALWTAFRKQPDMWRKAMEMNVFIADEQTLYAALRIINLTWTQINQAKNHKEVFDLANEMVKRVEQFQKFYQDMGNHLEKAIKAYEDGGKKLDPSGQSIITTANKLIKLSTKTQKELTEE